MKVISVPANENGVVRVFALSMSDAEAAALKPDATPLNPDSPLVAALGGVELDGTHVEVFPVTDLEDMALADYLIEGAGVQPKALDPHRAKLAALEGWVLVLYSSAFGGVAQKITPDARLTLIGSYPQVGVNWQGSVDLSTPSALPQTQTPQVKKRPSDAAMSGRVAMGALLVAFFVVGLMIWVGS